MQYTNLPESIKDAFIHHDFLTAEKLLIIEIKKDNLNAQLWFCLSEALAFQGCGSSASKVLERAWILDPQAIRIDNLKNDIKINDKGLEKSYVDDILKIKNVSVCAVLIVKYEESYIVDYVSTLINAVDEIIIINTSPTEIAIEVNKLAEKIKVIEFECHDDYSSARNFAFPYIKSDWAFFADADEYIFDEDINCLRIAASLYDGLDLPVILRVGIVDKVSNSTSTISYDAIRLFPCKYGLKYSSKIYDQVFIEDNMITTNGAIVSNPVRIRLRRFGYMKPETEVKEKLKRNIRIVEELENGGSKDPLLLFFIGRDLYFYGKFNESIVYFNECIKQAENVPTFEKILDTYLFLIKAYLQVQNNEEAEEACIKAINISADFPDLQYLYGFIKMTSAYSCYKIAEEYVIQSKQAFSTYRNIVSPDSTIFNWKADLLHADIALFTGNLTDARTLYEKAFQMGPEKVKESILKKLNYIQEEKRKIEKLL